MDGKVKSIIRVLIKENGKASLEKIYKGVIEDAPKLWGDYKDYHSVVRKTIYQHSSDADIFEGVRDDYSDLFYAVEGKRKGIWGLKFYQ